MKAVVQAFAASVGESAIGRWWWKVGEALDVAIPIAIFAALVIGTGAVILGLVN